jgi:hypothetical protein
MGAYAEYWDPEGHGKRSLSGLYYTHVHYMGKNSPCTAQKCNEDSKEGIRPGRRDAGCASGPFLVHPFSAAPPREGGESGVPPAPRRSARGTASQRSGRRTGQRGLRRVAPASRWAARHLLFMRAGRPQPPAISLRSWRYAQPRTRASATQTVRLPLPARGTGQLLRPPLEPCCSACQAVCKACSIMAFALFSASHTHQLAIEHRLPVAQTSPLLFCPPGERCRRSTWDARTAAPHPPRPSGLPPPAQRGVETPQAHPPCGGWAGSHGPWPLTDTMSPVAAPHPAAHRRQHARASAGLPARSLWQRTGRPARPFWSAPRRPPWVSPSSPVQLCGHTGRLPCPGGRKRVDDKKKGL